MPASTIDTFFACTIVVSVALIAMAFLAGTMQTQINSMQDLNEQSYLRGIADHLVSSYGSPVDWGSTQNTPASFGLSISNPKSLYALDIDKISRLNPQNAYTLSYLQVLTAAKINNIALGISISQILTIDTLLVGNTTNVDTTNYTFQITVQQDTGPVNANIHCYMIANNFLTNASNVTTSLGTGLVTVETPNAASGPAVLVVFAQASFDTKLCTYTTYAFGHLAEDPQPNNTFLNLSPLNNTLQIQLNYPAETIQTIYAFSYNYTANLTQQASTYVIPDFVDKSPIVIVAQGVNGTSSFNEWVAYPQVPLTFGDNFSDSTCNVFVYTVTIDEVLYRLTLRLGDAEN